MEKAAVQAGLLGALVLPWLTPLGSPPEPSLFPWLVTAACAVVLWLLRRQLTGPLLLCGWLMAALLSAVLGLAQHLGHVPLEMSSVLLSSAGQAVGNLGQKNQFASLTNIGLAALLLLSARLEPASRRASLGMVAAALLLSFAHAASASRTGLLQLAGLSLLILLWGLGKNRTTRTLLLCAWVAYVLATLLLPEWRADGPTSSQNIWGRLQEQKLDCGSRLVLWSNVLSLIAEKPWLGWGWGELDYAHFMFHDSGPRFCELLNHAHNLPLQLAVELGLPLALVLCGLMAYGVWKAKPWKERDPDRQAAWMVIGLILCHSMLEYPLWYGPFFLASALSLWLLGKEGSGVQMTGGAPGRVREWLIAGMLASFIAYVSWDYARITQIYRPVEQRAEAYRYATLEKIQDSLLFQDQVRFATYTLTPLRPDNAAQLHAMGLRLLHYSPEAVVVEKLIEAGLLLGRQEEAGQYEERYRAAYPLDYKRWKQGAAAASTPENNVTP